MDAEDLILVDVLSLLIVEHLDDHNEHLIDINLNGIESLPFFIASMIASRSFFGYLSNTRFSKTKTAAS